MTYDQKANMNDHALTTKALRVIDSTNQLHQFGALEKYIIRAIKQLKRETYVLILNKELKRKFEELALI